MLHQSALDLIWCSFYSSFFNTSAHQNKFHLKLGWNFDILWMKRIEDEQFEIFVVVSNPSFLVSALQNKDPFRSRSLDLLAVVVFVSQKILHLTEATTSDWDVLSSPASLRNNIHIRQCLNRGLDMWRSTWWTSRTLTSHHRRQMNISAHVLVFVCFTSVFETTSTTNKPAHFINCWNIL